MSISWFSNGVFHPGPAYPQEAERVERQVDSGVVLVSDVMTQAPLTAEQSDSCDSALEALEEEDFHHLPVVSAEENLVGVVSDRDLLLEPGKNVGEVMTESVLTATADTELQEAAKALIDQRFHCLVVIDEATRPIGIITSYDILSCLVSHPSFPLWSC